MLERITKWPNLLKTIWFTGEAKFYTDGLVECHLFKYAKKRTSNADELELPKERAVTVWAAMSYSNVVGPYFFTTNENDEAYQFLLKEFVNDLRKISPIHEKQIFMHDNFHVHTTPKIQKYLEEEFPHHWIGKGSNFSTWPHHSADLNPLNFCLWGFIKSQVYKKPIDSDDILELEKRILAAFKKIKPDMLEDAIEAYKEKLERVSTHGALVGVHFSPYPVRFNPDRYFGPSEPGISSLMHDDSEDSD